MNVKESEFISSKSRWHEACAHLSSQERIAVDIEANGLHAYPEHICLLQFASRTRIFLVDPAVFGSGSSLRKLTANAKVEKIFHSCDYDMRSLDRDYNGRVKNLFDTSIAAQFLGSKRLGLGNVLKEFLGITLEKSKKLQQMDWGIRPLPERALQYAADDVRYLIELRTHLAEKLQRMHRFDWVMEESRRMQDLRHRPPDPPEEAFKTIKGSRTLNPHQRAVLREVYKFRELVSREYNRPPFKIMSAATMIELAKHPRAKLSAVPGLSTWLLKRVERDLREALEHGRHAPPVNIPVIRRRSPWRQNSLNRLGALKTWRKKQGEVMSLDPSLLWPTASLERMALHPEAKDKELFESHNNDVRQWQRKMFCEQIAALPVWDASQPVKK
jgi:ribonuclease D